MFQIIILLLWLTTTESVAEYPVAKPGCQATCGNIDIPYPFGIGPNCTFADSFAVTCKDSLKPFINSINLKLEVLQISIENGTVQFNNPVTTSNCLSGLNGREVNLTGTPFSFSATYNRFAATGCNNFALMEGEEDIITGCISNCGGSSPSGACQTTIPPSLRYINATVDNFKPDSSHSADRCRNAFMVDYQWFSNIDISAARDLKYVPAVLDWGYNGTCNENARFCGANAHCSNNYTFNGSQCYCNRGYEGNPYLPSGCKDIDECSDPFLNMCRPSFSCSNVPGGFNCTCPDGSLSVGPYIYCLELPNNGNSRTKVIIAGTCSGLGVLLLLICSWLLMSNGAFASGKQSCPDVEYATDDLLTGPWEAAFSSIGSFYSSSVYPASVA
ncbi:hypothetical protein Vadar_023675 [Vaccinium darrowii]|uniref:Uncharacterized protein n=1 Tax=Vaccinium darrowii TaxID=229202 RepID=A0ACB7XK83_9ERIC|nr:hypothetical protein Vadar_023675 [Vaccinium darrowii]